VNGESEAHKPEEVWGSGCVKLRRAERKVSKCKVQGVGERTILQARAISRDGEKTEWEEGGA